MCQKEVPRCSYQDLAVVWAKWGRTKLHSKDHLQGWLLGWLWWRGQMCADMNELPCFQSPSGSPLSLDSVILTGLQGNCPGVVAPLVWLRRAGYLSAPFTWVTAQPWENINPVNYWFKPLTHPTSSCLSHPGPFPTPEYSLVPLSIENV